jgi:hypothetical protein
MNDRMDTADQAKIAVTLGGSTFGAILHSLGFDNASEFSWTMAGILSALLIVGWLWDRSKEALKIWRVWRALERRRQIRAKRSLSKDSSPSPLA